MHGLRWCVSTAALLTTLALLHQFEVVSSSYVLQVRAHRYWNSRHELSDGSCCDKSGSSNCDPWWCSHCQCDNRFKFCMRRRGTGRDGNENSCPMGSFSTGEIGDDSFSFGTSQIAGGVSNPMIFRGDIWRGGFQLLVSIYDEDDVNSDDHVDDVYAEHTLNPGGSISEREYTGRRGNSHVTLSFSLVCNSNFYGLDCTTYCLARNNDGGHYRCDIVSGAKRCLNGWADPSNNCLTPVCTSGCHERGGYCNSPGQCLCHSGWSGNNCQQCLPSSGCSTVGGFCNIPGECICREGYSGRNCEIDLIPCQRETPCSEGVLCTNDGVGGYRCHCPTGYTGERCEQEIDECDPNPCHDGATCIDEVGGFYCECPDGFEGEYCHIDINECLSNPCQNGATCVDLPNGFLCQCIDGYEGDLCDRNHDDCTPHPCENGGTCQDLVGGYVCECEMGWTGDRCQIDIDDCVPIPCQNGGTCFDKVNGYECVCPGEWEGERCESEVNECAPSPCQNGANCTDLFGLYNCTCVEGYYGSDCQYELNECLSNPCLNGAECRDLVNDYSCNCSEGFAGVSCEVDLFPCRGNPCQNGGTCVEHNNSYSCLCSSGFTDYNCLSSVDVQIEALKSNNEGDESLRYVTWVVPVAVLLILILVVAVVIIALYRRQRRKRSPMLPPPDEPIGNGMATAAKSGSKDQDFHTISEAENPVYTGDISALPEYHVYESLDTYAVPTNLPLEATPTKATPTDYCHPTVSNGAASDNPYANV